MNQDSLWQWNGSGVRRWPCICGETWATQDTRQQQNGVWQAGCEHGNRTWRTNPGKVEAHDQWFSEEMPSGKEGTTKFNLDLVIRGWDSREPIGAMMGTELKTWGRSIKDNYAELLSIQGMNKPEEGRFIGVFVLELVGGNCLAVPKHFPVENPWGLPETPVAATSYRLLQPADGKVHDLLDGMDPDDMVNLIQRFFDGEHILSIWRKFWNIPV